MNLINDTFRIVVPPDWSDENSKHGTNMCKEDKVGFFNKIIDESAQDSSAKQTKNNTRKANAQLWRWALRCFRKLKLSKPDYLFVSLIFYQLILIFKTD